MNRLIIPPAGRRGLSQIFLAGILGALFALGIFQGLPPVRAAETGTLRVGLMASLTGPRASLGRELRDGALLAAEEINARWKSQGQRIEVMQADDRGRPGEAEAAARRLVEGQEVDLLFGLADSDCALAVMPVAARAQIPLLTLSTHPPLTRPSQDWVFRGNISGADEGQILVDVLWEKIKKPSKRLAILFEDTAYGRAGAEVVSARLRQYGADPVARVPYARGERDFHPVIEKIKGAGTDGVLVYGLASDAPALLRARRDRNAGLTVMASSGWDTRALLELPPELTGGILVAGYLALAREGREELFGPSWTPFAEAYRARFGREPDVMAALGYSDIMCVAEAHQREGFEPATLIDGLKKTRAFRTLLESPISFGERARDGMKSIHMAEFAEGRIKAWKRNQAVKHLRFELAATPIRIGEYTGELHVTPPEVAVWMVVHFTTGLPPFIQRLPIVDEYGLDACYTGVLRKTGVKVPVSKFIFRSEEDAAASLNLISPDLPEVPEQEATSQGEYQNFRTLDQGLYADGTFCSGYVRAGRILVMAKGENIPPNDLRMILDGLAGEAENP